MIYDISHKGEFYAASIYGMFLRAPANRGLSPCGRTEALIRRLILEKEYVEFLVGREGEYDQIVSSTIRRVKREVFAENSSLVWVLPYQKAELSRNLPSFESYYTLRQYEQVCDQTVR